jgi:hypothetical protein
MNKKVNFFDIKQAVSWVKGAVFVIYDAPRRCIPSAGAV